MTFRANDGGRCQTCGQPVAKLAAAIPRVCDPCWETEAKLAAYLQRGGEKAREFVRIALEKAAGQSMLLVGDRVEHARAPAGRVTGTLVAVEGRVLVDQLRGQTMTYALANLRRLEAAEEKKRNA